MGKWKDGKMRKGEMEIWENGRMGNGNMGKWKDGKMRKGEMKRWESGRSGRKFSHLDVGHVGCFVHCSAFSGKEVFCDRVQNVRAVNLDLAAFPKCLK